MARNRMIRPEFWEDTKISMLSPYARLFFMAMWNFADDDGYLNHDTKWLKAKCLPYDDIEISELIKEIEKLKRIAIQNEIIHIVNFKKYQKIDKPKKSELKDKFGEHSPTTQRSLAEPSTTKEKLREVKTRQDKTNRSEDKINKDSNTIAAEPKKDIAAKDAATPQKQGASLVKRQETTAISEMKPSNVYHTFIESFSKLYFTKTNTKYNVSSEDYGHVKALIDKHGVEAVVAKAMLLAIACERRRVWWAKDSGLGNLCIKRLREKWNELTPEVAMSQSDLNYKAMVAERNIDKGGVK